LPRALDYALQIGEEVGIDRVIARLEGFDRLLAAGDQDLEQRNLSVFRSSFEPSCLPRHAATETLCALKARRSAGCGRPSRQRTTAF
jgi:hypothetical protein